MQKIRDKWYRVRTPAGAKDFLFSIPVQTAIGAQLNLLYEG
jgi:hypothetical protein